MNESRPPFKPTAGSNPSFNPSAAIALSVEARESSRVSRLHRTLQALLDATRANPPASEAAFNHLLGIILDALMAASEAHLGNLQLFDRRTQMLQIRVQRGFFPPFLGFFNTVHSGAAACGAAFAEGKPIVVEDVATSPLYTPESRRAMLDAGARSVQSLALVHRGKKLGVISVHYHVPGIPQRNQEAFAAAASLMADVVAAGLPRSS